MIATLSGVVSEKLPHGLVLEVGGIGYGLLLADEDFANLKIGEQIKLNIYEHIKEDAHDLYGFTKLESKVLFELLISVNGVGPKMGLSILSLGSSQDIRLAIAEGNTGFIQSASGVGKRLAERVVVDLKDKVGMTASDDATTFLQTPGGGEDEALQALLALGFSLQDAGLALKNVDPALPVEDRVKQALKAKQ